MIGAITENESATRNRSAGSKGVQMLQQQATSNDGAQVCSSNIIIKIGPLARWSLHAYQD